MAVEKGDIVSLDYEGKLESGEVFDSSSKGENPQPLEVEIGAGKIIPGFEKEVEGMEKGQEKEFSIGPEEAYGHPREDLKKEIPKENLPKDNDPKVGSYLVMSTPDGKQFPAKIEKIGDESITVDLNHPLAGEKLNFKIKVLDVKKNQSDSE